MHLRLLNPFSEGYPILTGKERNMKRNDQNNPQNAGYPQQNGYAPNAYPGNTPYQ